MNILAAVDFSPVCTEVLTALRRMAATFPVRVFLVHVAPPDPAFVGYEAGPHAVRDQVAAEHRARHQRLQELAEGLRGDGVDVTALMLQGATVATLLAQAERLEADLVVLGSHGHRPIYDLLIGSVAEGVVRAGNLPVLLVPAQRTTQVRGT
jgi:nucleotide-binding universal stress UspA family protein